MKTKFNNAELVHVWASQSQEYGNGSNMYFKGKTIYSYGSHFPIAHIYDGLTLLTSRGYSNTTAKHISLTCGSINGQYVRVPQVLPTFEPSAQHVANVEYFKNEIENYLKKAVTSRLRGDYLLECAQQEKENLKTYVNFFKLEVSKDTQAIINTPVKDIFSPEFHDKIKKQNKEISLAKREANKAKALELINDTNRWKDGEDVRRWDLPMALRIKDGHVETTKGAKVTLISARKLWKAIQANKPLDGFQIDYYKVNGIVNGVLVAGCHRVPMVEINRIGALLTEGV